MKSSVEKRKRSVLCLGQCPNDLLVTKEWSVDLACRGARLHQYDCLIRGEVPLSDLLPRRTDDELRELIGQLLSSSASVLSQCQAEELIVVYGSILIQSLVLYCQEMLPDSSLFVQWTRNLSQTVLHLLRTDKSRRLWRPLVEMSFPRRCPLLVELLDELFGGGQINASKSLHLKGCVFEVPTSGEQCHRQWFFSVHARVTLPSTGYPVERHAFDQRLHAFTSQLNTMWHEHVDSLDDDDDDEQLHLASIHERIQLLKERLPPLIQLSEVDGDLLGLALHQERISFNDQMRLIAGDLDRLEEVLSSGLLLFDRSSTLRSIALDLQRNRFPFAWHSKAASSNQRLSLIQFLRG